MSRLSVAVLWAVLAASLASCASVDTAGSEAPAVAVWDVENLSPSRFSMPGMGEILSGAIIDVLGAQGVEVVERERLVAVLEELRLGSSQLADDETRLRVGRITGAREMVFGAYMVVGPTMRLDLRRVDVETGRVVRTASKTAPSGDVQAWVEAARKAAVDLF
ncbi:MAG TPA: CsgG/HfaB family protein [Deltaproteobacteria bacterium]|mgnify:CR=1 FL=1|nr:CsgG/HfaB family protein [Deltaproteobacteria bacterium]HPP80622.1 CsgG/HfaB family protein [Deltaproteobacteria bacterium]